MNSTNDQMPAPVAALVADIRSGVRSHADPGYVAGTVAARSPGKPVLGVRIPLLRGAVRAGLRRARTGRAPAAPQIVRAAADALWHGHDHEDELAACMLLRLAELAIPTDMIRRWAPLLDNWLSVDELGAVVGLSLLDEPRMLDALAPLARSGSLWERRLYIVSLIRPLRSGLPVADVPHLAEVLVDDERMVRKASLWLVRDVLKTRPEAAAEFRAILPGTEPRPLVRLFAPASV